MQELQSRGQSEERQRIINPFPSAWHSNWTSWLYHDMLWHVLDDIFVNATDRLQNLQGSWTYDSKFYRPSVFRRSLEEVQTYGL
ncbi:uncharacterized protein ARMOST_14395 [Armillaria ostoyae]|uniref:Uncharacterized protein n=1 Tax=Armillaria ostoyae TaxID=47428 RepID=A0A284RQF8_ARMOS|nr:uncharacterized protein ARMOST_14395 [Armillaria ostoyae]